MIIIKIPNLKGIGCFPNHSLFSLRVTQHFFGLIIISKQTSLLCSLHRKPGLQISTVTHGHHSYFQWNRDQYDLNSLLPDKTCLHDPYTV